MRIDKALATAASVLETAGIENPHREARLLAAFVLQKQESFIFAHPEKDLTADELSKLNTVTSRRAAREPFQYITGTREFYGLDLVVTPDVLIPRPETEFLVESAIEHISSISAPSFLDIGTGSGCIPVSILKNVKQAQATAVDISPAALTVAKLNADNHEVADRLTLLVSDVFVNVANAQFDLITSNPPYISTEEMRDLQPEVFDHEPHIALTDGDDGLSIISRIVTRSPTYLKSGGLLLIEIGHLQSLHVEQMFSSQLWRDIRFIKDLQNIPRIVSARLL